MGKLRAHPEWAFMAIERIFDTIVAEEGSQQTSYYMVGHSAGAQFVHRHLLFLCGLAAAGVAPPPRIARAVCCNAGWWTMPTLTGEHSFPYDIGGVSCGLLQGEDVEDKNAVDPEVARAFVTFEPVTVLLGEEDTDPSKPNPALWNDDPRAAVQGANRFERGHAFIAAARETASGLGTTCPWHRHTVPRVGHDGGRMTAHAVRMLFDPALDGKVDKSWDPPAGKRLA